jgi:hypothetical protein
MYFSSIGSPLNPVATFLLRQAEGKSDKDWLFPSTGASDGHRGPTWLQGPR